MIPFPRLTEITVIGRDRALTNAETDELAALLVRENRRRRAIPDRINTAKNKLSRARGRLQKERTAVKEWERRLAALEAELFTDRADAIAAESARPIGPARKAIR